MSVPTVKEWLAGAGKEACRDAREWLRTLPEDATMDDEPTAEKCRALVPSATLNERLGLPVEKEKS